MTSPFIYEEPVGPGSLVDRDGEMTLLIDRVADGRNSRLEGPRRFGKTSLLRALLARAEKNGDVTVEVNFLGCVSATDVAQRIERAYAAQLDGPIKRWFDGLIRTLKPTISAAPGGVGITATPSASAPGLLDRLALPRRIHAHTGRRCVVAFDEFQEVMRIDTALPGAIRSELEQQGAAAGYVFCGSHPGLMREMFSDRRNAFFGQAAPVELGPLPADALAKFITERFAEGARDPGEALGPLLDIAEGHPQRAMLLAHHLYGQLKPKQVAGIEAWVATLAAAQRETAGELQVLWDGASDLERRVLKAIAHRTVALGSREAEMRFGLAKTGSNAIAAERLYGEGHIVKDDATRTGWRVVDPFLATWLRDS